MKCLIFWNFDTRNYIEEFVPEFLEIVLSKSWHWRKQSIMAVISNRDKRNKRLSLSLLTRIVVSDNRNNPFLTVLTQQIVKDASLVGR